jgi:hypothetical protein
MKYHWWNKTGESIDFSPRFLDTIVKRYDGLSNYRATAGAWPRLVLKMAAKYGCATTKTINNDTSLSAIVYRNDSALTDEAMEEAEKYRIPGYIRINDDAESVHRAIWEHGIVSQLVQIGSEWWKGVDGRNSWTERDISPLRTPAKVVSGHQVNPKGWNGNLSTLRNSWGYEWARAGEADYFPDEYARFIFETWAVADIPANVKSFLADLPAPGDFHYVFRKEVHFGQYDLEIKWAQIALMILGFLPPVPPEELGWFGSKTARAVEAFQRANGITPTSALDIGPKTIKALNERFAI